MKEKVVLAFSGGLDTSYCAKYLSVEKNLEVYTAIANTLAVLARQNWMLLRKKAYQFGRCQTCYALDVTDSLITKKVLNTWFSETFSGTIPIQYL